MDNKEIERRLGIWNEMLSQTNTVVNQNTGRIRRIELAINAFINAFDSNFKPTK